MSIPAGQNWEMIVVDNGSTDDTSCVIERFKAKLPIRKVFEPKAGLSNARNAGVAAASGDYILWTDDDVEVEIGWLAGYAAAFSRFPDGAVFGGRILPRLEAPSPAWFVENLDLLCNLLSARNFGDDYLSLAEHPDRVPYGANYAIRATEQRKFLYDPKLGVSPGRRRVGEETSVIKNILNAGYTGYWVPDAEVSHIISTERQTKKYVHEYFRGHGETVALKTMSENLRTRLQLVRCHGSRMIANVILFYAFKASLQTRSSLKRLMAASHHSGALRCTLYAALDRAADKGSNPNNIVA